VFNAQQQHKQGLCPEDCPAAPLLSSSRALETLRMTAVLKPLVVGTSHSGTFVQQEHVLSGRGLHQLLY